MNNAVLIFNEKLKSLTNRLNNDSTEAQFVYINPYVSAPDGDGASSTSLGMRARAHTLRTILLRFLNTQVIFDMFLFCNIH